MDDVEILPVPIRKDSAPSIAESPVRPFEPADVADVAALYRRSYCDSSGPPSRDLCDYFTHVFFTDPWVSENVSPSLVFVDADDTIRGFIGCHPRRFLCHDRTIWAVTMGQMMVDPARRRRGIAWALGRNVLAGPQTLTYGTTASMPAGAMWRRMGFWNPSFGGMTWKLLLPVNRLSPGTSPSGSRSFPFKLLEIGWGHVFAGVREAASARCRSIKSGDEWCQLHGRLLNDVTLRPQPDPAHFRWVWQLLGQSKSKGQHRSCLARDERDDPVGWVVYFVTDDRTAHVLEWAHLPEHGPDVVQSFVRRATAEGCRLARGRCFTPELTAMVVGLGARLAITPSGCVYHTTDADVRAAIVNGEAFLSELDSESWLNFAER